MEARSTDFTHQTPLMWTFSGATFIIMVWCCWAWLTDFRAGKKVCHHLTKSWLCEVDFYVSNSKTAVRLYTVFCNVNRETKIWHRLPKMSWKGWFKFLRGIIYWVVYAAHPASGNWGNWNVWVRICGYRGLNNFVSILQLSPLIFNLLWRLFKRQFGIHGMWLCLPMLGLLTTWVIPFTLESLRETLL